MIHYLLQIRKIVRSVRSSPQRRAAWLREVRNTYDKIAGGPETALMLILDVKTRWSSTHQMLRELLNFNILT